MPGSDAGRAAGEIPEEPFDGSLARRAGMKVLVVEDDLLIALALEQLLRDDGWTVIGPTPSAEQAVRQALRERPDAILMDIRLRDGMDGLQAAEAIRRLLPTPVIFCTAHSDAATRARIERLGRAVLLPKPVAPDALRGALFGLATLALRRKSR